MTTIFIFNDNFYPSYKSGGPVQSIINLVLSLSYEYEVSVITTAYEFQFNERMPSLEADKWTAVSLPGSKKEIPVWYAEKNRPGVSVLKKLLKEKQPDVIYLNGIFSYTLFIAPLISIKTLSKSKRPKIVISPRGMLQNGALQQKTFKKKIYLYLLKWSGLLRNVRWHATNEEERSDILKNISSKADIIIALNIPKKPAKKIDFMEMMSGELRLVYLSLITEKKNLRFLLEIIAATKNIFLDIYGPVKDKNYWKECEKLIIQMQHKVKYRGEVIPDKVQKTFTEYHASILLTKGENFGHALYESLSVGRPIITSNFTPWNNLKNLNAGWNMDIFNREECIKILNNIAEIGQEEFDKYCKGAYEIALQYFKSSQNLQQYRQLFVH